MDYLSEEASVLASGLTRRKWSPRFSDLLAPLPARLTGSLVNCSPLIILFLLLHNHHAPAPCLGLSPRRWHTLHFYSDQREPLPPMGIFASLVPRSRQEIAADTPPSFSLKNLRTTER